MIVAIQSKLAVSSNVDSSNATSERAASPETFSSTLSAASSKSADVQSYTPAYAKDTHDRKACGQAGNNSSVAVAPQVLVPPVPDTAQIPVISSAGLETSDLPAKTNTSVDSADVFSIPVTLGAELPSTLPTLSMVNDGKVQASVSTGDEKTSLSKMDVVAGIVPVESKDVSVDTAPVRTLDGVKASSQQLQMTSLTGETKDPEALLRNAIAKVMQAEPSQNISPTQMKNSLPDPANGVPMTKTDPAAVASGIPIVASAAQAWGTKQDQGLLSTNLLSTPAVSVPPARGATKEQISVSADPLAIPTVSVAQVPIAKQDQVVVSTDQLAIPISGAVVVSQSLPVEQALTTGSKTTPFLHLAGGVQANPHADTATTTVVNAMPNLTATDIPVNPQVGAFAATALQSMPATNFVSAVRGLKGMPAVRGATPAVTTKTAGAQEVAGSSAHRKISATDGAPDATVSDMGSGGDQNKAFVSSVVMDASTIQASIAPHVGLIEPPAVSVTNVLQRAETSPQATPVATESGVPAPLQHVAQAEPVAMPMVSSARLIQSIQQSDMRVGINSSEFGAISIHTSTSRGVVSSEITLGHEELAKAINAHLSAMPDKAGSTQATNVRLETSSSTLGSSGGSSHGSEDQKQQRSTVTRPMNSSTTNMQPWLEQTSPIATRGQSSLSDRLDIHV